MTTHHTGLSGPLGLALKITLGFGLLGLALWLSREQIHEVLERRPSLGLFGLAFAFYFSGVLLAFARWWLLVRALELPFRLREAMQLGLIGTLFNIVLPGAVGGDLVKAAYIARQQHRKGRAMASVAIDRVVGVIGLFVLAAVTGAATWGSLNASVRRVVVAAWIALAVTCLILLAMFAVRPHGPLLRRLNRPRLTHLAGELHATGLAYRQRLGTVALSVALAAVTHLGNVLAFDMVGRALFPASELPTLAQNLMLVPLILFSTGIPLPFGALGASEGVSAMLFQSVRFRGGAVTMLGFRMLQFGASALGAIVYLNHRSQIHELSEPGSRSGTEPAEADTLSLSRAD